MAENSINPPPELPLIQRLQNLVEGLEADGFTSSANDVREAIAALKAASGCDATHGEGSPRT